MEASDQNSRRVFISYDRRDGAVVQQLCARLQADNFDVWWDQKSLPIGARWADELTKAIKNAQFFIACVSTHYCEKLLSKKDNVLKQELQAALAMQKDEGLQRRFHLLLPLRLDDCAWPEFLSETQMLDWAAATGYRRLLEAMQQSIANWEQLQIRQPATRRARPIIAQPAPPLTRILFADTQNLLSGKPLPLVVDKATPSGLANVLDLRDWSWRRSALGRWGAADHEQVKEALKCDGALNFDLLIFNWSAENSDVAQTLYQVARGHRRELPLVLIAEDNGDFNNRNDQTRADPHLFTFFQPLDDQAHRYPARHAPFKRSNFLTAFQTLNEKLLPEAQARLMDQHNLHLRQLCTWLGGEGQLQLTVQKFFPEAREFTLFEMESFGAESESWLLQMEDHEPRYLLVFFAESGDYERALERHKQAAAWLGTGAAGLHLIPQLDDQREAFPREWPARYALCYHIAAPHGKPRTFTSVYRASGRTELGKVFGGMLKALRAKPRGIEKYESPWHTSDQTEHCPHEFCWTPGLRRQLLIALRDLEQYGAALYRALQSAVPAPTILTWEQCEAALRTLIYQPLPAWLTDRHAVYRGHSHGQPTVDRWLESGAADKLQLLDFGRYDEQGRLVTDLAILECDIKLRLLSTESEADGFGDLQINYLPIWCSEESAAMAGLFDYQPDVSHSHATITRAYQLIAQVRAEARKMGGKQDMHGAHYFAALLYLTLQMLNASSVRPTKKLLALHSAAEILHAFARLFPQKR